jgi:hypothetical protein
MPNKLRKTLEHGKLSQINFVKMAMLPKAKSNIQICCNTHQNPNAVFTEIETQSKNSY